jgi:hypothetical protein
MMMTILCASVTARHATWHDQNSSNRSASRVSDECCLQSGIMVDDHSSDSDLPPPPPLSRRKSSAPPATIAPTRMAPSRCVLACAVRVTCHVRCSEWRHRSMSTSRRILMLTPARAATTTARDERRVGAAAAAAARAVTRDATTTTRADARRRS